MEKNLVPILAAVLSLRGLLPAAGVRPRRSRPGMKDGRKETSCSGHSS